MLLTVPLFFSHSPKRTKRIFEQQHKAEHTAKHIRHTQNKTMTNEIEKAASSSSP